MAAGNTIVSFVEAPEGDERWEDHAAMLAGFKEAQAGEHDLREHVREARLFVTKRDGQWEPYWWSRNEGRPRYTFDQTNPIIDQHMADITDLDYGIVVKPSETGDEDVAEDLQGLIRHIQNISHADRVYRQASREMLIGGFDGWRIVQRYATPDSFEQDLVIEKVPNWIDRAWLGFHQEQDGSDADEAWVTTAIPRATYKREWPDGSGKGITSDRQSSAYWHKPDTIMVGEYLFVRETDRVLVRMTNGDVYEEDEDFARVRDELAAAGIREVDRRTTKRRTVWSRKFDGQGWLEDARETVFNAIPLVPLYANFMISEDGKVLWYGAVEKLLDPQRVLNYSLSRQVEEGSLAPRAKYWMTREQASGNEKQLRTLNVNSDPVQFYQHIDGVPPPAQQGGAQVNPGLAQTTADMREMIHVSSGMFSANMGDDSRAQSGVAIEQLQSRGARGSRKYIESLEVAQERTARILVDAIPRVYTAGRTVNLDAEDGTTERIVVGQQVVDVQSGQVSVLHDLTVGTYDVVCSSGPSFDTQQGQTVSALVEVAQVDPTVVQMGGDVLLRNISAPGMDDIAERKRQQLLQAGVIPVEQMTDEERAKLEQARAAQGQQPDPAMMLAQAELAKGQAAQLEAQVNAQEAGQKLSLQANKQQADTQLALVRAQTERQDADTRAMTAAEKARGDELDRITALQRQQIEEIKILADALKALRDAMGADAIMSPVAAAAYQQTATNLLETGDEVR